MFGYPLVSVIIPCYNYGHFLCETLENIQLQTYQNLECIIVDDGSTDNTKEIVQSYVSKDTRFRYFRQRNKGTSSAKNNGIRIATGEFIQFLDADDLLNKKKLEVQVLFLINNPDVDIIYGDVRYFDSDNPTRRSKSFDLKDQAWMPNVSGKDEVILKPLLINNIMVISAPLIRRKVFANVGEFNDKLKGCEDWDLWIRCALAGYFFYFDNSEDQFTFIRVHSKSASNNSIFMFNEEYKIRKALLNNNCIPATLQSINKRLIRELISSKELRAYSLLERGYIKIGFKEILNLISIDNKFIYYMRNALYYLKKYMKQGL